MSNKNTGSTVDDLWSEMGLLEEIEELAIRKLLAAELGRAMIKKKWTKSDLAKQLATSRPQIDRLLDPSSPGGITITTLAKAARVVGKKVQVKLVAA